MIEKRIIKATNNFKDLTSVYIYNYPDDKPIRRYQVMIDNRIYLVDLIHQVIEKTTIKELSDLEKIKEYDNKIYGGFFNGSN